VGFPHFWIIQQNNQDQSVNQLQLMALFAY